MSIVASLMSAVLKSVAGDKLGSGLIKELADISIGAISEKGINGITDFVNEQKAKIEYILSKDNMQSMNFPENHIDFLVAEIKELLSKVEITNEVIRDCKYDSLYLSTFLWNEYCEYKDACIEYESEIKRSLFIVAETLLRLEYESKKFSEKMLIQISNSVDDVNVGLQKISDYIEDNFGKLDVSSQRMLKILQMILEQIQKIDIQDNKVNNIIGGEKKFKNNKKEDYIKIWNSKLFLHMDNDEKPLTLKDAFVMPDYVIHSSNIIKKNIFENKEKETLDEIIDTYVSYTKNSTILITGVPGIGKSTISSWIANKYIENDSLIILRFRDWDEEELEDGLLKAICKSLECKKVDLNNKILILDGFDEIKKLDVSGRILAVFFNEILDLKNMKCIITSRPAYINAKYFQEVIELKAFDRQRIERFYRKIKNLELDTEDISLENLDILGIPVILYMAIMSNINITINATKSELYSRIFAEKGGIFDRFCHEGIAYDEGAHPFRNIENIEKYLNFLREIAFKMYENNTLLFPMEGAELPVLEFQGKTIRILDFPIKHLFENIESNIEFIHKSIYEYFVADYLFIRLVISIQKKNVDDLAETLSEVLKRNTLSDEIVEYLSDKILLKNISAFSIKDIWFKMPSQKSIACLKSAFSMMLKNGMTYYCKEKNINIIESELNIFNSMIKIFENCLNSKEKLNISFKDEFVFYISVAHIKSGNIKLKNIDLNGVKFKNVSLKNASFTEVNLEEAIFDTVDLSGVSFINVNLSGTQFINVNLNKTVFDNVCLENSILENSEFKNGEIKKTTVGAKLKNVDLQNTKFNDLTIKYLDLSDSNLKCIELYNYIISKDTFILFNNIILDLKLILRAEKILGDQVYNCKIDMCDNVLTYEEYCKFREKKLSELQEEILDLIESGKNYTEI